MGLVKWVAWIVLAIGVLWASLALIGAWRWQGLVGALRAGLVERRAVSGPQHYDVAVLAGLPAPVQRYFQAVLAPGQPMITTVTVAHAGMFNMGTDVDQWKPFSSTQTVVTQRPGFVWDGTIAMFPGVPVRVIDAYVGGEGILRPAIFGVFTLTHLHGHGAIAQGELMRFLAEAAWYPTALLPASGVVWTPLDDQSARATLTDGDVTVSLIFHFGDDGLIATVRAEARGRTVGQRVIPTPWEGRWSNYQIIHGMKVPMTGEVAWILPAGDKPYWRGTITAMTVDLATGP
jgi:hypothetical protein